MANEKPKPKLTRYPDGSVRIESNAGVWWLNAETVERLQRLERHDPRTIVASWPEWKRRELGGAQPVDRQDRDDRGCNCVACQIRKRKASLPECPFCHEPLQRRHCPRCQYVLPKPTPPPPPPKR